MSEQEALAHSEEIPEHALARARSVTRGGGEILVAEDGGYLLYGSTVDPAVALRDFLTGFRP